MATEAVEENNMDEPMPRDSSELPRPIAQEGNQGQGQRQEPGAATEDGEKQEDTARQPESGEQPAPEGAPADGEKQEDTARQPESGEQPASERAPATEGVPRADDQQNLPAAGAEVNSEEPTAASAAAGAAEDTNGKATIVKVTADGNTRNGTIKIQTTGGDVNFTFYGLHTEPISNPESANFVPVAVNILKKKNNIVEASNQTINIKVPDSHKNLVFVAVPNDINENMIFGSDSGNPAGLGAELGVDGAGAVSGEGASEQQTLAQKIQDQANKAAEASQDTPQDQVVRAELESSMNSDQDDQ